ncbi:carbon storage regulator [Salicibibacter kimchii]|uniref:Carbon storage regulator n=1 Tax=Salicibibacter kimchii TaxID=2099786 RepID=A0A345C2A1_9BACI|nr:carbon storage regulator [Salicibibacter kimchii]AXF57332.1 carbon storage regulator [Salicibibacter kimchii]
MALVLTRSLDQSIIINDNIRIRLVLDIGNQYRIAIDAPQSVKINREEVLTEEELESVERNIKGDTVS